MVNGVVTGIDADIDATREPALASGHRDQRTAMKPFERIVTEHGPTVLRVCRAVLGPDDAEDAWADTFLAALEAYPRLASGSNVKAWLITIAHRKAIDIKRKQARAPMLVEQLPDAPSNESAGGRDNDLWRALAALPRKQREAVAYHYLAGLPYKEIAAITGSNAGAARRAAADGIATLRRIYLNAERSEGDTR
jgi:RNA polymerase sigma factor (sigma-70 family)